LFGAVELNLEIQAHLPPPQARRLHGVVTEYVALLVGVDRPSPLKRGAAYVAVGFVQMERPVLL
jgi:hypothetical protein